MTAPEKARVMLMLISEARKVFSDEASRRRYDRELEESKRKPKETATAADPMKEKFDRFYSQAQGFYKTKQFDLAMTAIEKAMSAYNDDSENTDFLYLAAEISIHC